VAMAGPQWRTNPALSALLFQWGDRIELHQLIRLIHCLHRDRVPIGYTGPVRKEPVRLYGVHELISPTASVKAVSSDPPYRRRERSPIPIHVLTPSGLADGYNPCSLPAAYIEQVRRALDVERNPVVAEFLDLFNHRLLSLEHRAWEKPRFYIRYERKPEVQRSRQTLSGWLYALAGSGFQSLAERLHIPDRVLLRYAGLLLPSARPGANLRNMINDLFGVAAEVVELRGRWYPVGRQDRASLDASPRVPLREGLILGARIWYQQASFRIRLGPLSFAQYQSFLPGTRNFANIVELAHHYTRRTFDEIEIELTISENELPSCELSGGNKRPQLGRISWLLKRSQSMFPPVRSAVFRSTELAAVVRHRVEEALLRVRRSLDLEKRLQLAWSEDAVQVLAAKCGREPDPARIAPVVLTMVERPLLALLDAHEDRPARADVQVNHGKLSFCME
jgi:type VI secretion system protein ImpH